jgi:hypothetical protein
MKKCPQCNRTYADESITFCLADGALLSAPYDSEVTKQIPAPRLTNPPATEILYPSKSQPIEPKGAPKFIYALAAVMGVLVIVLASIIIVPWMSQQQTENSNLNQRTVANDKSIKETPNEKPEQTVNASPEKSPPSALTTNAAISSSPPSVPAELTGRWQGQWSSPFGTIFAANVYLETSGNSTVVQGYINWTMKSSPQEAKQAKIGLTAVEYIKGSYNPEARLLTVEGYRKDDPNDIIALDKYRLVLAADNRSLGGATRNHGGWRGRLSLSR